MRRPLLAGRSDTRRLLSDALTDMALLWAAFILGVASAPHCAVMCSATCAGVCRDPAPAPVVWMASVPPVRQATRSRKWSELLVGRALGYAASGSLAGGAYGGLYWLSEGAPAMRPVWALAHASVLAYGLIVLATARHPVWVGRIGHSLNTISQARALAPVAGALLALMPCALLYSALLIASLSGSAVQGAACMLLFAIGSSAGLVAGPWVASRTGVGSRGRERIATRLTGLALAAAGGWALWMGIKADLLAWCA